jgi:hypothetical protein
VGIEVFVFNRIGLAIEDTKEVHRGGDVHNAANLRLRESRQEEFRQQKWRKMIDLRICSKRVEILDK